jgi:hypothetical protein
MPFRALYYVNSFIDFHNPYRLLSIPKNLPRSLIFPVSALLDRPVKGDGLAGAIGCAAAAVPAFIRVQDNRGHLFFRIGDKNVDLANFHAVVAAGAGVKIENYRSTRTDHIRQRIRFFTSHDGSPYFL